jgi:hypothetical protein
MMDTVEAELERLLAEETEKVRKLRHALGLIEWVWNGEEDRCPSCGMRADVGHDWSCATKDALTETK